MCVLLPVYLTGTVIEQWYLLRAGTKKPHVFVNERQMNT